MIVEKVVSVEIPHQWLRGLDLYFTEIADRHDIWISRALVDRLQRDVLKD